MQELRLRLPQDEVVEVGVGVGAVAGAVGGVGDEAVGDPGEGEGERQEEWQHGEWRRKND